MKIQQKFPTQYDLSEGRFTVGIQYPPGWSPSEGPLRMEVTDNYPRDSPTAYIPEDFRYKGDTPKIVRYSSKDGWSELCIHPTWDPDNHSTVTWLRLAQEGLENPNASNPWR
jgi:hypothetical protein